MAGGRGGIGERKHCRNQQGRNGVVLPNFGDAPLT